MGRILHKICNLKTLLFLIAVWLLSNAPMLEQYKYFERSFNHTLFRVALSFSNLPSPKTSITVVHVSDLEYERWLMDLPSAESLLKIFNQLESDTTPTTSTTVLGLVLEQPFALVQPESEGLLVEVHKSQTHDQHLYDEVSLALSRREELVQLLNSNRVVIGLKQTRSTQLSSLSNRETVLENYPLALRQWLWSFDRPILNLVSSPALAYHPASLDELESESMKLVVADEDGLFLNFSAALLSRFWGLQQKNSGIEATSDELEWTPGRGLHLGGRVLSTSPNAEVVPLYGEFSGIFRPTRQLSLSAALTQGDLQGWVLVGRDGSQILAQNAQHLAALGDNAYLHSPLWVSPLQKGILIFLLIFLLLGLPLLSVRRIFFAVVGVIVSLSMLQIVLQVLYAYWVPNAELVFFTLFGALLMLIWRYKNTYYLALRKRADEADMQLSLQVLESAPQPLTLDQAFDRTRRCSGSEQALETLYKIGVRFEELGDTSKALEAYQEVRRRRRRYHDVHKKIKALKETQSADEKNGHEEAPEDAMENTQVIDSGATQVCFGRYRIDKELGRGASGTVYLGFDPLISRQVAIKALDYHQFSSEELSSAKARFVREAEAAGGLNHPNIVQVFDVGEQSGSAFIAMDYAKGRALSECIHEENLLDPFDVYRIILSVAEALEYAHQHKIVHRDVKPGNILYCDDPFGVKVTDFGIARFIDHSHTQTGEILGSPLYMAPEQILGQKVSYSADVFSLGVTFYQLLTGHLPFEGESLASLSYDIVHTKPKGARSVRKELPASATRITNVALQKKPSDRYPSAEAMAEALRKAIKRDFSSQWKALNQ